MATVLEKEIKRELIIAGQPYTITISPQGVKIVEKGKRKGREITWADLVSGDVELTVQLEKSLAALTDRHRSTDRGQDGAGAGAEHAPQANTSHAVPLRGKPNKRKAGRQHRIRRKKVHGQSK